MDNKILYHNIYFIFFIICIFNSCTKDDPQWNLEKILPKVKTLSITEIRANTALVSSRIIHNGGYPIIEKGICYAEVRNPSVERGIKLVKTGNEETYTLQMQNLNESKVYYVRSYARNKMGIAYGEELTLTTKSSGRVQTLSATSVSFDKATLNGNVVSDGNSSILKRGFDLSENQSSFPIGSRYVDSEKSLGNYSYTLGGLKMNTTYYFRAFLETVDGGEVYGNVINFITTSRVLPTVTTGNPISLTATSFRCSGNVTSQGSDPIISRGICYSTSPSPTIISLVRYATGGGSGAFTCDVDQLQSGGTTYYIRAFATSAAGTSYGNQVTYVTGSCTATITTNSVTSISSNAARSGGVISSNGGFNISSKGVVWSTSQSPTVSLSTKTNEGSGSGNFTSQLTGLSANTTYYVRAYATNSCGTSYGNQFSFQTTSTVFTGTITIGTGTSTEAINADPAVTPFGSYYSDTRHIYLIRASEITNQGGRAGNIASISFDVVNRANITMNNFSIKIGTTSLSEFNSSSTSFSFSVTANYVPFNLATFPTGWREFPLPTNTPFFWDGSRNIIIEACFDNSSFVQNTTVRFSNTSFLSNIFNFRDNSSGCSLPLMYLHNQRPNISLNFR
jgi:hypothetical protein